mmetsp:Transcript_95246/g.168646  ORF Transcript_95246/g.168646 Transcript_95246/m.168646 type:complete len:616 (+) Transcript_95246:71-1918(+)
MIRLGFHSCCWLLLANGCLGAVSVNSEGSWTGLAFEQHPLHSDSLLRREPSPGSGDSAAEQMSENAKALTEPQSDDLPSELDSKTPGNLSDDLPSELDVKLDSKRPRDRWRRDKRHYRRGRRHRAGRRHRYPHTEKPESEQRTDRFPYSERPATAHRDTDKSAEEARAGGRRGRVHGDAGPGNTAAGEGRPVGPGKSNESSVNSTTPAASTATNLSNATAATTNLSNATAATSDNTTKNRQCLAGISACMLILLAALALQARSLKATSSATGMREHSTRSRSRLLQSTGGRITDAQQQDTSGAGDLASVAGAGDSNSGAPNGASAPGGEDRRLGSISPPEMMKDENDEPSFTDERALQGVKLLAIMFLTMLLTRLLVCDHYQLQCDTRYTLSLFMRQDIHKVVLDIVFLFLVGRIGSASPLPVDSVAFILVVFVSSLVPSLLNELDFMKHSLSMYEVMCSWSAATWLFAAGVSVMAISLGLAHLWYFYQRAQHRRRAAVELLVVLAIFVLPRAFQPGYHMHHWYVMWLLALPCRAPTLWSRATQAFLIGGYVNGVAVYGRDPVLACQAAFDLAYNEQCKFYLQCTAPPANGAGGGAAPAQFTPPDWRTCNAGDYA